MNNQASLSTPEALSISDFSYALPDERIAQYPLEQRDSSKLLVYKNGEISEKIFNELPSLLESNDCLVFNDTRVIHARMRFQKPTGSVIEILCLDPVDPVEVTAAFSSRKSCVWKAMVGNAKKWKGGEALRKAMGDYTLTVELISKEIDTYHVRFSWDEDLTFSEVLEEAGTLPLPPYLNRDSEAEDEERYQTVYAQADGSVAAPTAGLHFTPNVFDALAEKDVKSLFVTLHVGAGTFKPVKSDTMKGHEMHKERIQISISTLEKMREASKNGRLIAVGTTSLRTIESMYWFGVKLLAGYKMEELFVGQWEPYELGGKTVTPSESLDAVLAWLNENNRGYLTGYTQLLIAPGYEIRLADALITNFHQPQSTLLLLVSAFIGPDWRNVYNYALEHKFRFLSFGDSSILFRR